MSPSPRRSPSTPNALNGPVGLAAQFGRFGHVGLVGLAGLIGLVAACGSDSDGSSAAEEGRRLAVGAGCAGCHGANGEGGVGPPWVGLFGSEVPLEDGTTVVADEAYITRSITEPGAQRHAGFTVAMPENDLSDEEVVQIVAYIVELEE